MKQELREALGKAAYEQLIRSKPTITIAEWEQQLEAVREIYRAMGEAVTLELARHVVPAFSHLLAALFSEDEIKQLLERL
jgi:hypothetical protein